MFFAPFIELFVVLVLFVVKAAFVLAALPGIIVLTPSLLYGMHLKMQKRMGFTPRLIMFANQVAVVGGFLAAGVYLGVLRDAWEVAAVTVESVPDIFDGWDVRLERLFFAPAPFFRALVDYPSWVWVLGGAGEGAFLLLFRLWDVADAASRAPKPKAETGKAAADADES